MSVSAQFTELVKDQLAGLGPISVRNMFGGAGIYHNGIMFALIADDILYLKIDESTRQDFETKALLPFSYEVKGGRNTIMSYRRAPERCLEDPAEMLAWAGKAYAAAVRSHKPRKERSR